MVQNDSNFIMSLDLLTLAKVLNVCRGPPRSDPLCQVKNFAEVYPLCGLLISMIHLL